MAGWPGTITTKRPARLTSCVRRAPLAPIGFFVTCTSTGWPFFSRRSIFGWASSTSDSSKRDVAPVQHAVLRRADVDERGLHARQHVLDLAQVDVAVDRGRVVLRAAHVVLDEHPSLEHRHLDHALRVDVHDHLVPTGGATLAGPAPAPLQRLVVEIFERPRSPPPRPTAVTTSLSVRPDDARDPLPAPLVPPPPPRAAPAAAPAPAAPAAALAGRTGAPRHRCRRPPRSRCPRRSAGASDGSPAGAGRLSPIFGRPAGPPPAAGPGVAHPRALQPRILHARSRPGRRSSARGRRAARSSWPRPVDESPAPSSSASRVIDAVAVIVTVVARRRRPDHRPATACAGSGHRASRAGGACAAAAPAGPSVPLPAPLLSARRSAGLRARRSVGLTVVSAARAGASSAE